MSNYTYLVGAESVQNAGHSIQSAADTIHRAASSFSENAQRLIQALDDHAQRFVAAVELVELSERNHGELERLRTIANELGAQLSQGPLACKKCGMRAGADTHLPLELCPRVLDGLECREPDQHHEFEPGDPL